jgi:signal transduction histidine kinase
MLAKRDRPVNLVAGYSMKPVQLFKTFLKKQFPSLDGRSLQFRLTLGVTLMAIVGVGSISAWTAWRTQEILINSHKQLTRDTAARLPEDVKLYSDMMPMDEALQRAVDNRTLPEMLIVVSDRQGNVVIPSDIDENSQTWAVALVDSADEATLLGTIETVGDRTWVLCKGALTVNNQRLGTLYVAKDITTHQTMFVAIIRSVLLVNLLVIGIMTLALASYVRRSLQPLKDICQMTRNVCPDTMGTVKLHLEAAPTEVNDLAETCDDMLERLSYTWDQQRQFVNDVSHELRTPLTLVSGYLQSTLRRSKTLTEPQREALEIASAEANRTITLLEDLLELARADSGNLRYSIAPLCLNEWVVDLAHITENGCDRSIQVTVPDDEIWVLADRDRLKHGVIHLIDNALNYSAAATPIVLSLKRQDGYGAIAVHDSGCGIPLHHQSRVFDRFYRVDEARSRATGGSGLGLSIVKTLIEGMNGQVSVSSKPNEGSTFTITLPLTKANT